MSALMTAILLAACIQKPQASKTSIVHPTFTATSTEISPPTPSYTPTKKAMLTFTPTPMPTHNPTHTPTNNPLPTLTPTPTATPTLTNTPMPTSTPAPTNNPINPLTSPTITTPIIKVESPSYCINISIKNNTSFPNHDLEMVTQLNFLYVKQLFQWTLLEPQKDYYDWSLSDKMINVIHQYGLRLIARLDVAPDWALTGNEQKPFNIEEYANFVHDFVSRYKHRVFAVEIWNEPNLAKSWANNEPNPEAYVDVLKAGYNAAKAADPGIVVISGAPSATGVNDESAMEDTIFLERMYEAGAAPFFDVLGAHGTGYKAPPEMSLEEIARTPYYGAHRSCGFRRIEDLRQIMIEQGDSQKQIWLTEFGWTSDPQNQGYSWYSVPEKVRADYYVRAFYYARYNWKPWIGMMCVWTLGDREWKPNNEMYWWAILDNHGDPKPAFNALRDMQK